MRKKPETHSTQPSIVHHLKHSPLHKTKTAKTLKIVASAALLTAVIAGGVFAYTFFIKPSAKDAKAQQDAVQLVESSAHNADYQTITSTFGFSLRYNTKTFTAEGQVTDPKSSTTYIFGQSYAGKDLSTPREYSIVKLQLPDQKQGSYTVQQPELSVITNIRKDYFTLKLAQPENKGKSELDVLVEANSAAEAKNGYIASAPTDVAVNGTKYRKITYLHSDESFGIRTSVSDIYYQTVQNDRPYTIEMSGVKDSSTDTISVLEAVIKTITFKSPDTSKLSAKSGHVEVASASIPATSTLPSGTSNVPNALDPATVLNVVARNQSSVVRVGTIYCSDINLLLPNGSVGLTLHHACGGEIGSGSFVSKDGYIATNGHVVRISLPNLINGYIGFTNSQADATQKLQAVLQYLVDSGTMTATDVNGLIDGIKSNDQTAIDKLNAIGSLIPDGYIQPTHDQYSYAIQTSDEPMRADMSDGLSWKYTKTVIPATYVDSDIDPMALKTDQFVDNSTHSDVAILKAKGTFPVVQLGTIDGLKAGDELTAIGFPAFVDDGIQTKQTYTVPSITQGHVEQIGDQNLAAASGHILIVTDVPIAQGNSGGPAFDMSGKQIGLNTYGAASCADLKCFGDGTARDIADYKALLLKNSISLQTDSPISDDWNSGLQAYITGDYQTAAAKFASVSHEYPASYLAPKFAELAQSKLGSAGDTSVVHATQSLTGWLAAGFGVGTFMVVSILSVYLVRGSKRHHAALLAAGTAPVVAVVPIPQSVYLPPAPVSYEQPVPVQQIKVTDPEDQLPPTPPPSPPTAE